MEFFVIRDPKTLCERTLVFIDRVGIGLIKGPHPEVVLDFVFDIDIANHGVGVGLRAIGRRTAVLYAKATRDHEFVVEESFSDTDLYFAFSRGSIGAVVNVDYVIV